LAPISKSEFLDFQQLSCRSPCSKGIDSRGAHGTRRTGQGGAARRGLGAGVSWHSTCFSGSSVYERRRSVLFRNICRRLGTRAVEHMMMCTRGYRPSSVAHRACARGCAETAACARGRVGVRGRRRIAVAGTTGCYRGAWHVRPVWDMILRETGSPSKTLITFLKDLPLV